MSSETILVPVDGSSQSIAGLEYACSTYPEARLFLLHVVDLDGSEATDRPQSFSDLSEWVDRKHADARAIVEEAETIAAEYGHDPDSDVWIGSASTAIVAFAEQREVDHIIIGSRGTTEGIDVSLGSVAESVVRKAPALVSVIR